MEKNRQWLVGSRFRGNDGKNAGRHSSSFPRSSRGQASWKRGSRQSGSMFTAAGMGIPVIATGGMFRNLVLALVVMTAGGCGYQLRGSVSLPPGLDAVRVAGPIEISNALTRLLDGGGIHVRSARGSTGALLQLGDERFNRRVLSVDPDTGKESEFELAYQVTFEVTGAQGEELVPKQTISLIRDHVFDADSLLGSSREQNVLHTEMRRDAAAQILRRIEGSLGR